MSLKEVEQADNNHVALKALSSTQSVHTQDLLTLCYGWSDNECEGGSTYSLPLS